MRQDAFRDRRHAGQVLAELLLQFAHQADVIVLALPRGGVPVGFEIAQSLHAPLDVFLVRKLGVPGYPELAMGAIASGGARVINPDVVESADIPPDAIERVEKLEREELKRREQLYREGRELIDVRGKRVILVDDGLATGSSMRAAIVALRTFHPAAIIVAVPVAPNETCNALRGEIGVDDVVCAHQPELFGAVGYYYEDFTQTTDNEVRELLRQLRSGPKTEV